MIVVDASLAVKLVIPEVDSVAADRWFIGSEDDIGAPDLVAVEVSQAIVRRVNDRTMTLTEGRAALQAWHAILEGNAILTFRMMHAQIAQAAELAMQLGHPVKDCVYLALAMERGGVLATCDVKFANKARAVHPAVELLSDYGN